MTKAKIHPDLDAIDDLIKDLHLAAQNGAVERRTEVLAQLYQARALNEIAQSLYELVRDGIGVKRDDN